MFELFMCIFVCVFFMRPSTIRCFCCCCCWAVVVRSSPVTHVQSPPPHISTAIFGLWCVVKIVVSFTINNLMDTRTQTATSMPTTTTTSTMPMTIGRAGRALAARGREFFFIFFYFSRPDYARCVGYFILSARDVAQRSGRRPVRPIGMDINSHTDRRE